MLKNIYNKEDVNQIMQIDDNEYKDDNFRDGLYYTQDVQNCIQKSDIHLTYNPCLEDRKVELSSSEWEYKSVENLKTQIVKYVSLIFHPGIVTPSAQERCMQIAFNAKNNSGCISRQVGAVVTDQNFSIKSIGWNDVPSAHVPCMLRSAEDLLKGKDEKAFSQYELSTGKERETFYEDFKQYYNDLDTTNLKGLNCSFCFKDIQNHIVEKGENNQVHTRSLHAEENAMLQISKYGGQELKNGILFTTASPCELCSKKAKQLEIKEIYYIDPYPGIAKNHILKDGLKNGTYEDEGPNLINYEEQFFILFSGAVGQAFHKLYEPFMSYKDEMSLRLNKWPKKESKKLQHNKFKKLVEEEVVKKLKEIEEKSYYNKLIAFVDKYDFEYPEDKLINLAKEVKTAVNNKAKKYSDWSKRNDIKAELKAELKILLAKNDYPSVDRDEVYKEIFEQAENFI